MERFSRHRAVDGLDTVVASRIELLRNIALLPRMRQLRGNVTGHDSASVAAAETHGFPLVTADARLARVDDLRCEVRWALPTD